MSISSEWSLLLVVYSTWWREESESQEKKVESMSNMAALPSLSHKLMSVVVCSSSHFACLIGSWELIKKHHHHHHHSDE